ncbi:proline-rich protein 18 [Hoplias malabaricus]|uniref:proline-rich protein 18 n=1 Tax=Hoplias malabaricus TaxID=27720 RepID=UPI0034633D5A
MPFPPINLHSPGKELFRKKKPSSSAVPPPSLLGHKQKTRAEKEDAEQDSGKLSTSWPSANLKQLGRKQQQLQHQQAAKFSAESAAPLPEADGKMKGSSWNGVKPVSGSCESEQRSSSGELRFSLSLTPEAVLVLQKRNLEKQMLAKQQKCCGSADFRHRRVFPSKRPQGGSRGSAPAARPPEGPADISAIVKISLLNEQHKYDDVEYEEEDGDVDETVVRKCKEWLKGVESAAAFSKVDKLSALPHLKSC